MLGSHKSDVLNHLGLPIDQSQIVGQSPAHVMYGQLLDKPAGTRDMVQALHGKVFRATDGRVSQIHAIPFTSISAHTIAERLHAQRPFVVGLDQPGDVGHAYVVTAMKYNKGPLGQLIPVSVVLRDPWPKNQSRIEISWNRFAERLLFGMHYEVTTLPLH